MPVRSSSSSVLVWPDRPEVDAAVRSWASRVTRERADIQRIAYFGSYARGDWGPGSDLDLLIVVAGADEPFVRRAARWDVTELPVPVDLLVYTEAEWRALDRSGRFARTIEDEAICVYRAEPCPQRAV
jgi:predicted nucleotidyltransferase